MMATVVAFPMGLRRSGGPGGSVIEERQCGQHPDACPVALATPPKRGKRPARSLRRETDDDAAVFRRAGAVFRRHGCPRRVITFSLVQRALVLLKRCAHCVGALNASAVERGTPTCRCGLRSDEHVWGCRPSDGPDGANGRRLIGSPACRLEVPCASFNVTSKSQPAGRGQRGVVAATSVHALVPARSPCEPMPRASPRRALPAPHGAARPWVHGADGLVAGVRPCLCEEPQRVHLRVPLPNSPRRTLVARPGQRPASTRTDIAHAVT